MKTCQVKFKDTCKTKDGLLLHYGAIISIFLIRSDICSITAKAKQKAFKNKDKSAIVEYLKEKTTQRIEILFQTGI